MARKPGKSKRTADRDPEVKVSQESLPKKKSVSPLEFVRQVWREGKKVTWTGKNETAVSTLMVFIMVVIMSLFFLLIDQIIRMVMSFILGL